MTIHMRLAGESRTASESIAAPFVADNATMLSWPDKNLGIWRSIKQDKPDEEIPSRKHIRRGSFEFLCWS